jgi:hypothetical protein
MKTIRFEQNITYQKFSNEKIVMRVLEFHDGFPVRLYEIPMCFHQDFARYRFYKPNYN